MKHKKTASVCSSEEEGENFKKTLIRAKDTQPRPGAWRVDTDGHDGKDYVGTKTFISDKGSTFSVKPDGDIISVCVNKFDTMSGSELLQMAVKAGGTKLDSFDGNFSFYLKNGFEPVSWTKFDMQYKPKGWRKTYTQEAVVFFKYTGVPVKSKDAQELKISQFYKNVKMSEDYNTAKSIRDMEV